LKEGPEALGYGISLWTTWRVADLIARQTGQKFHPGHVWRILRSLGWSCQRPTGRATQRDEPAIQRWKRVRWPDIKKSAATGPNGSVCGREWLERAAAPGSHLGTARPDSGAAILVQLEVPFGQGGHHDLEFLFPAFPRQHQGPASHPVSGTPATPLRWSVDDHLGRSTRSPQPAGAGVCRRAAGAIPLEFLPAYAPELNPVEYIWGYCKQHELPNLCPKDFGQLSWAARKALGRMRRRPTLVESFWKQAELF